MFLLGKVLGFTFITILPLKYMYLLTKWEGRMEKYLA